MVEILMPGGEVDRNAQSFNFVTLFCAISLFTISRHLVDWRADLGTLLSQLKHVKHGVPVFIELLLAALLGTAGFVYCGVVFTSLTDGATTELGKGSALLGTIAAISFSYARTFGESESTTAKKIRHCGEGFFHASLIAGTSFILSAASTLLWNLDYKIGWPTTIAFTVITYRFAAAGVFFLAICLGWTGFYRLNKVLFGMRLWRKQT